MYVNTYVMDKNTQHTHTLTAITWLEMKNH